MADAGRVQREPLAGIAAAPMTARRPLWRRLLPWYWASGVLGLLLWIPILWFLLAYAGLPRLWSHHEHKVLGERDAIVSYTAQDIPGDPINLRLKGSEAAIRCAFQRAGWHPADPVSVRSAIGIATSVLFRQPYPDAPVSPLYFEDKAQTLAFQKDIGRTADERHHVRLWQTGDDDWMAAATFDRGVGLSLFTLQITHHIGPAVDSERDMVGRLLVASGARPAGTQPSGMAPGWHRNGGGDRYQTDGKIHIYRLAESAC